MLPEEVFINQEHKENSAENPAWIVASRYYKLIEEGISPAIILESKVHDKE